MYSSQHIDVEQVRNVERSLERWVNFHHGQEYSVTGRLAIAIALEQKAQKIRIEVSQGVERALDPLPDWRWSILEGFLPYWNWKTWEFEWLPTPQLLDEWLERGEIG